MGAIGGISTALAVLIMFAYVISFPVFYGIFALSDHEDWECFASQDYSITVPWMGEGNPPGDYHAVHSNFYMVNLWGFINFMIPIGVGCLALCCYCICRSSDLAGILGGVCMFIVASSYIG